MDIFEFPLNLTIFVFFDIKTQKTRNNVYHMTLKCPQREKIINKTSTNDYITVRTKMRNMISIMFLVAPFPSAPKLPMCVHLVVIFVVIRQGP